MWLIGAIVTENMGLLRYRQSRGFVSLISMQFTACSEALFSRYNDVVAFDFMPARWHRYIGSNLNFIHCVRWGIIPLTYP
jgi:hypothetical protein